jgi:hypothetical protein
MLMQDLRKLSILAAPRIRFENRRECMGVEPTWDDKHPTNGFEDRGAHRNSRTPKINYIRENYE